MKVSSKVKEVVIEILPFKREEFGSTLFTYHRTKDNSHVIIYHPADKTLSTLLMYWDGYKIEIDGKVYNVYYMNSVDNTYAVVGYFDEEGAK